MDHARARKNSRKKDEENQRQKSGDVQDGRAVKRRVYIVLGLATMECLVR